MRNLNSKQVISKSFLAVLLGVSLTNISVAYADAAKCKIAVQSLIKQKDRPEPITVEKLGAEDVWRYLENHNQTDADPRFFKTLESVNIELLKTFDNRDIFFVARDGEWLYDSMMTALMRFPQAKKLSDKVHLLNLSRPVTEGSNPETLLKYLETHGLNIEAIAKGKSRITMIDTGERGSIFITLLQKIVTHYKFSEKNWKEQLNNLITGIDVRLLHSLTTDNKSKLLKKWDKMSSFDREQIANELEDLGFDALIVDQRKEIGLPTQHYPLHQWIVSSFERRNHWNGRATSISGSGKVTDTEEIDTDRHDALYNQAQIISHFSNDDVAARFHPAINAALKKCDALCLPPLKKTKTSTTKLPTPEGVKVVSGTDYEPGDVVQTSPKAKYKIIKFLDEGKRGKAFRSETMDGEEVVLKVAVDNEADTLKSFSEEAEKNKGYKLAKFPHAKLIEYGKNFMVKEFISGTRADEWLKEWVNNGMPSGTPQLKNLSQALKSAAQLGVYIGDLNPKNLIWDGKKWVIIDSGTWRDDLDKAGILDRYKDKVVSRWTKHFASSVKTKLAKELGLGE